MSKKIFYIVVLSVFTFTFVSMLSCGVQVGNVSVSNKLPTIFPDYMGVTIPVNIAPLNFRVEEADKVVAILRCGNDEIEVRSCNECVIIPQRKWRRLTQKAQGGENIEVTVISHNSEGWIEYLPFKIKVAAEPIDSHIVYRLIEPGYETWCMMGIYQRCLENFTEKPIIENSATDFGCVNCHSFCNGDPSRMLFHMRQQHAGTFITNGTKLEKLNTHINGAYSPLVYPSWHPSGDYIAFSLNTTRLITLPSDHNRVEVFDSRSDVVVYDVKNHEVVSAPNLYSDDKFETFPTFSPDGRKLYFCSADSVSMPDNYKEAKYSLCEVEFNPETRSFGQQVDTLYNARIERRSVSFPRVSPDGRYMLYALADYGNFSIWHRDADLQMIELDTGIQIDMSQANSPDAESYHSWSRNSRWILFNSRRINGLYTHAYITYIDNDGRPHKPFLLPQRNPNFYDGFMCSYNIPEFITSEVRTSQHRLIDHAKIDKGIDLRFVMQE